MKSPNDDHTISDPGCGQDMPKVGYVCTRPRGHTGSHLANSLRNGVVAIWDGQMAWTADGWVSYHGQLQ